MGSSTHHETMVASNETGACGAYDEEFEISVYSMAHSRIHLCLGNIQPRLVLDVILHDSGADCIIDLSHVMHPWGETNCLCSQTCKQCYHSNDLCTLSPSVCVQQLSDALFFLKTKVFRRGDSVLILDSSPSGIFGLALAFVAERYLLKIFDNASTLRRIKSLDEPRIYFEEEDVVQLIQRIEDKNTGVPSFLGRYSSALSNNFNVLKTKRREVAMESCSTDASSENSESWS